jgi:hypothetical protein
MEERRHTHCVLCLRDSVERVNIERGKVNKLRMPKMGGIKRRSSLGLSGLAFERLTMCLGRGHTLRACASGP